MQFTRTPELSQNRRREAKENPPSEGGGCAAGKMTSSGFKALGADGQKPSAAATFGKICPLEVIIRDMVQYTPLTSKRLQGDMHDNYITYR